VGVIEVIIAISFSALIFAGQLSGFTPAEAVSPGWGINHWNCDFHPARIKAQCLVVS